MDTGLPVFVDNQTAVTADVMNTMNEAINSKQDKVAGKGLSTNDFTTAEKNKLTGLPAGATVNQPDAFLLNRANHTGTQAPETITDFEETVRDIAAAMIMAGTHTNLSATYDDGGNAINLSVTGGGGDGGSITIDPVPTDGSGNAAASNGVFDALALKVDKAEGMGLSSNDFTTEEKTKLVGIENGATANFSNAQLLSRGNHTGTQSADTIDDGLTNKVFTVGHRTKLDAIAIGATANQSDAFLLARSNHTGSQTADSITDGAVNKAFTAANQTKLAAIQTNATANDTDANLKNRANHTGTQTAATISDFAEAVQDAAAAMIVGGTHTNITVVYNDAAGTLSLTGAGGGGGSVTIDAVPTDGSSNAVSSNGAFDALALKVDKDGAKVLTDVNFTAALNTKLAGIATGATANATDAQLRDRSTHTGVQPASSITEDATHRFVTDTEKSAWNAKLDATSPALLGSPTTTTPAASDNSSRIPNTAWVQSYVASNGGGGTSSPVGAVYFDTFFAGSTDSEKFASMNEWHRTQDINLQPTPAVLFGSKKYTTSTPIVLYSGMCLIGAVSAPSREFKRSTSITYSPAGGATGTSLFNWPASGTVQPGNQNYPNAYAPRDVTVIGIQFNGNSTSHCLPFRDFMVTANLNVDSAKVLWYSMFRDCGFVNWKTVFWGFGTGLIISGTTHVQAYSDTAFWIGGSENTIFTDEQSFMDSSVSTFCGDYQMVTTNGVVSVSNPNGGTAMGLNRAAFRSFMSKSKVGRVMITARRNSYCLRVDGGDDMLFLGTQCDAQDSDPMFGPALKINKNGSTPEDIHFLGCGFKGCMAAPTYNGNTWKAWIEINAGMQIQFNACQFARQGTYKPVTTVPLIYAFPYDSGAGTGIASGDVKWIANGWSGYTASQLAHIQQAAANQIAYMTEARLNVLTGVL